MRETNILAMLLLLYMYIQCVLERCTLFSWPMLHFLCAKFNFELSGDVSPCHILLVLLYFYFYNETVIFVAFIDIIVCNCSKNSNCELNVDLFQFRVYVLIN